MGTRKHFLIGLVSFAFVCLHVSCSSHTHRLDRGHHDHPSADATTSNVSPVQYVTNADTHSNTERDWSHAISRIEAKQRRLQKPGLKPPTDPAAAQDYFLKQRLPAGNNVLPLEKLRTALADIKKREQALAFQRGGASTGAWDELGPGNIGGRTRAIVINPVDPTIMYAAGAAGGVWKSTDAGASWATTDDLMLNLAVSTLVMDPTDPDTLYAGTGEGFQPVSPTGQSIMRRGLGIFKTVNAGVTWTQLTGTVTGVPTGAFYLVSEIVISPADPNRVYAGTRFGVWKSVDAGTSWTLVLHNPNELADASPATNGCSVGCLDLAIRSDTAPGADTLLAAFGSFTPDGLFRSTDSGVTWTQVGTAADLVLSVQGRMEVAIAPSNNNIMFATMADNGSGNFPGTMVNIFRSLDGGVTWAPRLDLSNGINTSLFSNIAVGALCGGSTISSQGWYDNVIAIDPLNAAIVWVGGIDLFRSVDGGQNFQIASYWFLDALNPFSDPNYLHADHHALVFHPDYDGATNQVLFSGTDGGLARTDNAGAAASNEPCPASGVFPLPDITWTDLNNGYGVTQFYHGDSARNADIFGGGTQDNSTPFVTSATTPDGWSLLIGGDGGYFNIDPTNSNILYGETQGFPTIRKSIDGGQTFFPATNGIIDADGLFITPVILDQSNPNILWTGGSRPWRTMDGAASWAVAGSTFNNGNTISAIAVAPSDSNVVYMGFANGWVARSIDALSASPTWTEFGPPNGLNSAAYVSSLAVHPDDPDIAYCTYSTFDVSHIFRTADGGATWTSIDGLAATGVPDIPVHWIAVRPCKADQLFVGTELGVFSSEDEGATWNPFNSGFANVVVESLDFQNDHHLVAFTHGRGAFRTPLDCPCDPASPFLDCNGNAERDECDIAFGSALDCNTNGIPDACDVVDGVTLDCNTNGIPDECETDCNNNGIPDECDITDAVSNDCDFSGIPDECENDCNNNGLEDSCDIADETSLDDDGDGIPDECVGACCTCADCTITSESNCLAQQGSFSGLGVECAAAGCLVGHDDCGNAIPLPSDSELTVPFDNRCATNDGPPSLSCDAGAQLYGSDLWYTYVAPCCGTLTVSLCDAPYDGFVAIYGGSDSCECPMDNSTLVDCADDTCGAAGGPAFVSTTVNDGGCYTIRAGGWQDATGLGDMQITMACGARAKFEVLGQRDVDTGFDGGLAIGLADLSASGDFVFQGQARASGLGGIPNLDDKVHFFDISDPANPDRFLEWDVPGASGFAAAEDVKVAGDLLFISLFGGGNDGVEIVDIRDPRNPVHLSFILVPGFGDVKNSFHDNGYLYMASGVTNQLAIVDLTTFDPDNPPALIDQALWTVTAGSSRAEDVTVQDGVMYVAAWNSGLHLFDVSDIANQSPVPLGAGPPQANTSAVWPTDDGSWVVTTEIRPRGPARLYEIIPNASGVNVLLRDTIESQSPSSTGFFASAMNVVVVGKRAYVTWNEEGLRVFDVDTALAQLSPVDTYDSFPLTARGGFFGAWGVYPFDGPDRILVSDQNTGLNIVRLTAKPISISYPQGRVDLIDPDNGTVLQVAVSPDCASFNQSDASVFVRNDGGGGGFVEIPLSSIGGNLFEATLPAATCQSRTDYYVRVETVSGIVVLDPSGAPAEFYTADVGKVLVGFFDDFETDQGWTTSVSNCAGVTESGAWERADPIGTGYQTEDDFTDGDGTQCYVTGAGGGVFFAADIDGGPFRLTSPTVEIGQQDVRVKYARWFYANLFNTGPENLLKVDVSGNGGATWVNAETIGSRGTRWVEHEFLLSDVMPPADTLTVRFTTADCPGTSVAEAAIDDFSISSVLCSAFEVPEIAPAPHDILKNRFISIAPNNPDTPVALRVQLLDLQCNLTAKKCNDESDCKSCVGGGNPGDACTLSADCSGGVCEISGETCDEQGAPVSLGWVGDPFDPATDRTPPGMLAARVIKTMPALRNWTEEVVHIGDCEIAPSQTYGISATADGAFFSSPLVVGTTVQPPGKFWTDMVGSFNGLEWSAPNQLVNVDDVSAVLKFLTLKPAPHITRVDLVGEEPNFLINAGDLQFALFGFKGDTYPPLPFSNQSTPENCP